MKKIVALALAIALACALCTAALADGSLEKVTQSGKFILGLDDSFPPMGYRDENNEIVGFDIDLAREVSARLGVELVLQPIDWSAKELELSGGNIDCIWNGMSRTDEREQSMALSADYMNNKIVLMVKDEGYAAKEDLADKVVAVQSDSFAEEVLDYEEYAEYKATLKEVRAYPDYLTAIMDLQNGNVDAVAIDLVVANYRIASLGDDSLRLIDDLEDDLFCVGFRKDDVALRDAVDAALKDMAKDGALDEICAKWFGENISLITAD
jgi:polar amino acid transport system substrate-binding protein